MGAAACHKATAELSDKQLRFPWQFFEWNAPCWFRWRKLRKTWQRREGGRCLVRRTWGDRLSATNDSGDLYQLRDTGAVTEWGQFLRCLQGGLQWMNEQEKESDFQPGTYATKQGVWASFCNNRSINITNLPVVPHKAVAKVSKIGNL